MDKRILQSALSELEAQRSENQQEEMRRREKLSREHPAVLLLEEQRMEAVRRSPRAILAGRSAENAAEINALSEKIRRELLRAGLPEDYLSPIVSCEKCHDEGYYYDERNVQCLCPCVLRRCAGLEQSRGMTVQDFAHFDETIFPEQVSSSAPGLPVIPQRASMRLIRGKCETFVDQLPDGRIQTLLLQGESGLGKTFLLHCVEHAAQEKGIETLSLTAFDWFNSQRLHYFSNSEDTPACYTVPLLLIDDLGTEPLMEGLTVEFFQHLINERLMNGKYTVLSTNLNREELRKRYTERVASRLYDKNTAMPLLFAGKDIRLK